MHKVHGYIDSNFSRNWCGGIGLSGLLSGLSIELNVKFAVYFALLY